MQKRYLSIWFPYLLADWLANRQTELRGCPVVVTDKLRNRIVVIATNEMARNHGIYIGMTAADAKAITPGLVAIEQIPGKEEKLLHAIGEWCIRFAPFVAVDMPDGLLLDISGCSHLWDGEEKHIQDIEKKFSDRGYHIKTAIADTIGAAWANARHGKVSIIEPGRQADALLFLPPAALRLENDIVERLYKIGFYHIKDFIQIKRSALRRRFGQELLLRLDQALGNTVEAITPIQPATLYEERLPCLEAIRTAAGIEIALNTLLEPLCRRLQDDGLGLRKAVFKGYRVDGKIVQIDIGTNRASRSIAHLFKLFELKISLIEPALGIELFTLTAIVTEDMTPEQEALWSAEHGGLEGPEVAQLLDRIAGKIGTDAVCRYLPQEHYWPERSVKPALSLTDQPVTAWTQGRTRPLRLLAKPALIEVTVPIPDYPPLLFIYRKKLHNIKKADGPERIEREWWLEDGEHRDYYKVEDQDGRRYWLFREGHYNGDKPVNWFLHGFFS